MMGCKEFGAMPLVGLGCWKAPAAQTEEIVFEAIKAGYRLIDGACDYGNEVSVGAGIKRAIEEGICKREELFVTTKLWNTFHRKEHVPIGFQKSLDDLGLDYVDLYLIHFPIALKFVPTEDYYPPEWTDKPGNAGNMILDSVPYRETWEAMEALHTDGKVKNIGVSNLTCQSLMELLTYCKVKPAVNQVELHLYLQQPQLVAYCQANSIALTGFSALGAISYIGIGLAEAEENCLEDAVVKELAATKGKSPAQVCLRFQVQRGVAVIPKASSVARLKENLDIFSFQLTDDEMDKLKALDRNRRFNDPGVFAKGWGMPYGWPIYG